jgi:hypothetical protein
MRRRLLCNRASDLPPLRVADMIQEIGGSNKDSKDWMWPRLVDVLVHIHHMLLSAINEEDDVSFPDEDELAGPSGVLYCIVLVALESEPAQDSNTTNDDESQGRSFNLRRHAWMYKKCT